MEVAKNIKNEYVVRAEGIVNKRPEKNVNAGVQNGDIELEIRAIEILNPSDAMPFDISSDTSGIDEEFAPSIATSISAPRGCRRICACEANSSDAAENFCSQKISPRSRRRSSPSRHPRVRATSSCLRASIPASSTRSHSRLSNTSNFS